MILAPIVRGRKGEYKKELDKLARQGFVRARIDGVLRPLDEEITLDRRKNHTIEVVVDRLLIKPEIEKRLEASIETATKLADGLVLVARGQRSGAPVFAKAGVPGLRRERAATGAAVVLLQQPVRRVRNLQRAGQPLELRSGESDRGPFAPAARRRARAIGGNIYDVTGDMRLLAARLKIPIQKPFEELPKKSQAGAVGRRWSSGVWIRLSTRKKTPAKTSTTGSCTIMSPTTCPDLRRQAPEAVEPGGESERHDHRRSDADVRSARRSRP